MDLQGYRVDDGCEAEHQSAQDDEVEDMIFIPKHDQTVIEIDLEDLPPVQELIDLFVAEETPLLYWTRTAIFYYKKERFDEFVQLLEKMLESDQYGQEKDRLRAWDMLAAHCAHKGNQTNDKNDQSYWFEKARNYYSKAETISRYDQNHLIGNGSFNLMQDCKETEAETQFDFVLNNQPSISDERLLTAVHIGKACLLYMQKNYKASLEYFRKCLRGCSNCPAFVRLGIGYCFAKLGQISKAKAAFERCIELDPENVDAQVAIAVIQMTSLQNDEETQIGIQSLTELYKKNKNDPMILNHLANHFFTKSIDKNTNENESLEKAKKLLDTAIQVSKNDQSLAETNFHLARYYHAKNQIEDANRHYYEATQFNHPKFVLPIFGHGQTLILKNEPEQAITAFEKVLKIQPNSIDTLKVLGALYIHSNIPQTSDNSALIKSRVEKAQTYLNKAITVLPNDIDVLLELAFLFQRYERSKALILYDHAIREMIAQSIEVPAEVFNNVGVLHYHAKSYERAGQAFESCQRALMNCKQRDGKVKAKLITVKFNLARVEEKVGKLEEADRLYREILNDVVYCDAKLRLACIAYLRKDVQTAVRYCSFVNERDPTNIDAWLFHGSILSIIGRVNEAQEKYEKVLNMNEAGTLDPAALVMMGNVWMKAMYGSQEEKWKFYKGQALKCYFKALELNPRNIYAANGLGCILAQSSDAGSAYDVFSQVQVGAPDYQDVCLNIAHVKFDLGHYAQSAQLYQSYLTRFSPTNRDDLYVCIAYAFYKAGQMQDSLDFINRALKKDPNNCVFLYNRALVAYKYGMKLVDAESPQTEDVKRGTELLSKAEGMFRMISKKTSEEAQEFSKSLSRTQCGQLAKECIEKLSKANEILARVELEQNETSADN